jgi:mono/diheme cytochrome c family protein
MTLKVLGVALVAGPTLVVGALAADEPQAGKSPVTGNPPLEVINAAPKGTLHNPYTDQPDKIGDGHKLFLSYGCSGCHGGGGGGGMGPPLTKVVWIYGSDDDTLLRLVTLGSEELQKRGYSREGVVNVIGPMPPFGQLIKSDDELFKLLAWVRSV